MMRVACLRRRPRGGASHARGERGHAAVELSILLPMLMMLLMMALEGGLFLAEHISVVNAAREGARFLVDGGTDAELTTLITDANRRLGTNPAGFDAWVLRGQTSGGGVVTITSTSHPWVGSSPGPVLTASAIQTRLNGTVAGVAANLPFVAVEVAYRHAGITGRIALPTGSLTLRSYTLIRRL
jgi:Flp pilus assembly protein TadG